jgi:hypothetical protein
MVAEITFNSKGVLIEELLNISKNMKSTPDFHKKMFHYSAAYGICDRTLRLNYDRELLMVAMVLQHSYNMIIARGQALGHDELTIPLNPDDINHLADLVEKLAIAIRNDVATQQILERINEIAYKTTGAGYYLHISNKIP